MEYTLNNCPIFRGHLILVDTKNLGEQAEQEFMAYVPNDDNRKFTELYNVQRLNPSFFAKDSQVRISTIQRMCSLLKDQEMDEAAEQINPAEMVQPKQPMPVVYNGKILFRHLDMLESRRMKRRIVLIALLLLCGAACGKNVAPKTILVQNQRGLAAWYGHGDGHHGKITANGERFDKNKLTAAHFTLPFGTKVRVHNLQNGRKVVVRINDRFPVETLQKGRIIDLSYGAAKKLRMVRAGIVSVLLEIISLPK